MELGHARTVVTGGASGIGRALAEELARVGARILIADMDAEGARAAAQATGGDWVSADVGTREGVTSVVEAARSLLGGVDLYCSNAGVAHMGGPEAPDADYERSWEVNVMAHVRAARLLLPDMLRQGRGHFLVTASAAGLLTQLGSLPYSLTKHAAVAFAEWISITYGSAGVTASVLCPQGVRTKMTEPLGESGGVVGVDGMLEPADVARVTIEALREDRFLVLPHPQVATYFRRKADDYERWISGMRRLQERFFDTSPSSKPSPPEPGRTDES
ncbi:MAG: dehydrogenase [Acidimicrobiales bacterium]|nr:MAG: dehydrogenase [Acidimicrobiales bacterium]